MQLDSITTVKYEKTIAADSNVKGWRQFNVLLITLIPFIGFVIFLILSTGGILIHPT